MSVGQGSVVFSSQSVDWPTPRAVYAALNDEFHFTLDPCRLGDAGGLFGRRDGLVMPWAGERVFCNPPYGPGIVDWLAKSLNASLSVYLLPARTDTRWFHDHCLQYAREVRFIRGRLKFGDGPTAAPFPSMIVVYERV